MLQVLDQYDDGGRLLRESDSGLAKIASKKKGVSVDKDNRTKFPDEEFALLRTKKGKVVGRFYPLVDLANSLVSYCYFLQTGKILEPKVRERVKNAILGALRGHGMPIPEQPETLEKTASAEFDFPDVVEETNERVWSIEVRGVPVTYTDREQLEKLASSLNGKLPSLKPVERRSIALQLVVAGLEDLPDGLAKYASMNESPSRGYNYERRRKILKAHRPDAMRTLDDIESIEDLEKQAALLDQFDSTVHMRGTPDAFLSIFGERPAQKKELFSDEALEKVASIMGPQVGRLVKSGKVGLLNTEQRRVLSEITAKEA